MLLNVIIVKETNREQTLRLAEKTLKYIKHIKKALKNRKASDKEQYGLYCAEWEKWSFLYQFSTIQCN